MAPLHREEPGSSLDSEFVPRQLFHRRILGQQRLLRVNGVTGFKSEVVWRLVRPVKRPVDRKPRTDPKPRKREHGNKCRTKGGRILGREPGTFWLMRLTQGEVQLLKSGPCGSQYPSGPTQA